MIHKSHKYNISLYRKKRGAQLLEAEIFSDIFILVGDSRFRCHRFMLARASEFFEKLFQRDGLDTGEVRLGETTPKVFQIILQFIYSEDMKLFKNLKYKTLLKIAQNANMWLISDVEKIAINHLKIKAKDFQPEQLIELYAEFHLLNNQAFMKDIICMMKKTLNRGEIPLNFFQLEFNFFKDFLKISEGILVETVRFSMAEGWILNNPSTYEFRSILSFINFKEMTMEEFHDGPGKSMLLTDGDKEDIMSELMDIFLEKIHRDSRRAKLSYRKENY